MFQVRVGGDGEISLGLGQGLGLRVQVVEVTRLASSETDVPLSHSIEITQWVNVQGHQPNPRYSSAVRFQ